MKLENISNNLFTFTIEANEATLTLHQAEYQTTIELANILGWIHQIGVNRPEVQLKIGAQIKEKVAND